MLIRDDGRPKDSLPLFQTAIDALEAVRKKEPSLLQPKEFLRNSYWGRAEAYHDLGRYAEALKDWDRTVENATRNVHLMLRTYKNLTVVRTADANRAVAEIDLLRDMPLLEPTDYFNFTRIYAVAATKFAGKKDEYIGLANEMLRKAVKAGFKDTLHLKTDVDLKPLRADKDYQKLIKEMDAKFPAREILPLPRGGR